MIETKRTSQEQNILLYMLLRLVLLFSVLISLVVFQVSRFLVQDMIVKTYFVTFLTFLVTSGFVFMFEKARNVRYFLASQITYDILFTTVLIFYTGTSESMFTIFYMLNIIFAAILFPWGGAIIAAVVSAVLYGTIAWINTDTSLDGRSFSVLTTITGFLSLSLLASQLVEELKKSRQRVGRLEELSEEIVNSLDSGLLGVDAAGLIRKINRTAEKLLGIDYPAKLIGRSLGEALPMLGGISQEAAVRELSIGGQLRRIMLTRVSLPDSHSMMLLRDLTDVLELEERVRRGDRLASVGRLATGVAHEIRNPIASISGAAQLLEAKSANAEEQTRLTSLIVRESERVDRLVNQLLKFARPPVVKRDKVNVEELLENSVESIRARPEVQELGLTIKVDIKTLPIAEANRDELQEVINNLLVNSVQAFTDQKSSRPKEIRVKADRQNGEIRIMVEDNGPGIPREFRGRVFDPFFTTKPSGTGLGLAQVHKIMRDHNGQVDLDTDEGRGTSVTIRLPAGGVKNDGRE